jgi:hypothetical protein
MQIGNLTADKQIKIHGWCSLWIRRERTNISAFGQWRRQVLTQSHIIFQIFHFHPSALTGDASRKSDSRQADKKYMDDAADGQGGKNKHFWLWSGKAPIMPSSLYETLWYNVLPIHCGIIRVSHMLLKYLCMLNGIQKKTFRTKNYSIASAISPQEEKKGIILSSFRSPRSKSFLKGLLYEIIIRS